jgi:hypothetical protein
MSDLWVSTRGQIFDLNEINALTVGFQKSLTFGGGRAA